KEMHLLHHSKGGVSSKNMLTGKLSRTPYRNENEIPFWENRTLTYSQFRYSLVGVKKERGGLYGNILPPAYQIFNGEKTKIFFVEYAITNGVVNGSEAIGIKNMLPGDLDIPSVVPTIVEGDKETSREQFDIQSRLDEKEHIHLSEKVSYQQSKH
ncbi:hypothetical protein ACJX0J_032011, partial [Zea mays]